MCRFNGFCSHEQRTGKKCHFAHPAGVKQTVPVRVHNKHTQMCLNFQVSQCDNPNCNFAHSEEECMAANEILGRDCSKHLAWFWEEVKASEELANEMYDELSCIEPSTEEQSFLDACIDEQDEQEAMDVNPELALLATEEIWAMFAGMAREMGVPLQTVAWGDMMV